MSTTSDAPNLAAETPRPPASRFFRANFGNRLTKAICKGAALFVILLALALFIVLIWKSWLSIETTGLSFFTNNWDPEESHRQFGGRAFIWGTLFSSALAMALAVPLGVGAAAFLAEIAPPWARRSGSILVEMLAAVPSVVYGFWAREVLGPGLQDLTSWMGGPNFGGVGMFPAGIILAIMIVPYVTAVSFDVCRAVPNSQREAALALGATRWQTIRSVVLPYAGSGIIGASFIALGRAIGETMAVTMIIGNSPVISLDPFAKGSTIASAIANEFTEATYDLYLSALVELALVLFLVAIIVNSLARLLIWRVGRVRRKSSVFGLGRWRGRQTQDFSTPVHAVAPSTSGPRVRRMNRVMTGVLGLCLAATVIPLFLVLGYLLIQGLSAVNWQFFVNLPAAVGEPGGGMANALVGSALLVGMATLFAVPVGLLAAIYLTEFRDRRLGPTVRFVGELLGGVPSIVVGIVAYTLIIQTHRVWFGRGGLYGWAGAIALAVMMIPIVMRASEEALKMVPQSVRHASLALGANDWQTLLRVTVPAALPAIVTAVFLAIARIVGETAPLLLTAGNNRLWPTSLSDYTPSLPVTIFQYAISSDDDWKRQAWAAALILLTLVMLLNFGIRFLTGKRVMLAGRGD